MLKHILNVAKSLVREHITKATTRSNAWASIRKAHLKKNPTCAACGGTQFLQVHHKEPFHLDPSKELDLTNLITLCMGEYECHLKIGHGDNFKAYNPTVEPDSETVRTRPDRRFEINELAEKNRKTL
jgi:5-methylcytosine-specific restriction endonuclease McrA